MSGLTGALLRGKVVVKIPLRMGDSAAASLEGSKGPYMAPPRHEALNQRAGAGAASTSRSFEVQSPVSVPFDEGRSV